MRNPYISLCVGTLLLLTAPPLAMAQQESFAGRWQLNLQSGRAADYGILEIDIAGGTARVFIDGGPVELLTLEEEKIAFTYDWSDSGDQIHVSVLSGALADGSISGEIMEADRITGNWSATRWQGHSDAGKPPAPLHNLAGVWSSVSRGTHKDSFALTPTGRALHDEYDASLDDPHLRCVPGGLIRMEDGPMDYEIIQQADHILIIYEYFSQTRRIWTDGRSFPQNIDDAWLAMGYSIGHWEGSTLVVETRGMKPTVWDALGMPVSASAVLVERKYLDEAGMLHTDYTLRDPAHYERPIYRHAARAKKAGGVLQEYVCDPQAFYRSLEIEGRLEEYWQRSGKQF